MYNSSPSQYKTISCGVPQGSVLGPLLFLIYINNICNSTDMVKFCLFADDTNLLYNHSNVTTAINNLNMELKNISEWFLSNKLSINLQETNFIIFRSRQNKYNCDTPLLFNGSVLNQVKGAKFLGIYIDENLSWQTHIDNLSGKISKNTGVMNRLKFFLPSTILLNLYNSFVLSYLNYCILIWGGATSKCNKLFLLQKRAVRVITKSSFLEHTSPLFAELQMLKFNDLYNFNLGKFMFKLKHNIHVLPINFNSMFTFSSSVHSYCTRGASKGDYYINYNRTSI